MSGLLNKAKEAAQNLKSSHTENTSSSTDPTQNTVGSNGNVGGQTGGNAMDQRINNGALAQDSMASFRDG